MKWNEMISPFLRWWRPLVRRMQLTTHWPSLGHNSTYSWASTGVWRTVQPGTTSAEKKKSFHCVLPLITCLGSGGLNRVTVRAPSCWRGHGKCERQSPSVLLKDFIATIPLFTLHYGHYRRRAGVFYHSDVWLMLCGCSLGQQGSGVIKKKQQYSIFIRQ